MESFYGGKPGFSFIIVKSFPSIAEMVRCFKQGPSYSAVHYDEHVLINTTNKNDPDNGKVYRRGYDYKNNMGGAVYIGTIVGPAGRAPMLEMTTIADVKSKQAKEGYDYRYTEGRYAPTVNLVPGKDGNKYNDAIEWAVCCIRNENNEDSTAYIGFKFPYLVEEFTAQSVSPYYNRNSNNAGFVNQDLITRTDDKSHPYYEKWHINIPKGIKGDAGKNFRVIPAASVIQDYIGKADDVANGRKVLVYDYYHYDKEEGGEPVTIYLGDYNMIDNININDEGTITIDYSHDNDKVFTKLFKWIKTVTLDSTNGHFKVVYNHTTDKNGNPTTYETDLAWVKNITLAHNGTVKLQFTGGKADTTLSEHLRWIDSMEMKADGTIVVNYNDGTKNTFNNQIQWITNVSLTDEGIFTVKFNNGAPDYVTTLKWVDDVAVDPDGTVKIIYNSAEPKIHNKMIKYIVDMFVDVMDEDKLEYALYALDGVSYEWINNNTVKINGTSTLVSDGNGNYKLVVEDRDNDEYYLNTRGDQRIHVVYNTGEIQIIGDPLKYIHNIYLGRDNQLHVVYSTGEEEVVGQVIKFIKDIYVDSQQRLTIEYNTGEKYVSEPIKFVRRTYLNDDLCLTVEYNTGQIEVVSEPIKFVNKSYLDNKQRLNISYNTGDNDVVSEPIKFIDNMYIDTRKQTEFSYYLPQDGSVTPTADGLGLELLLGGNVHWYVKDDIKLVVEGDSKYTYVLLEEYGDQQIHVQYNTGEMQVIGNPINYIVDTALTDDFHYVVYYSDPLLRQTIVAERRNYPWFRGANDWLDLGSVKEDSGLLIGMNLSLEDEKYSSWGDITTAITKLNDLYPEGLTNFNLYGKIITIGSPLKNDKKFYAFDYGTNNPQTRYNYNGWYYLGDFSKDAQYLIVASEDAADLNSKKEELVVGGVWFIVEG